jgi:hypothetical protein
MSEINWSIITESITTSQISSFHEWEKGLFIFNPFPSKPLEDFFNTDHWQNGNNLEEKCFDYKTLLSVFHHFTWHSFFRWSFENFSFFSLKLIYVGSCPI